MDIDLNFTKKMVYLSVEFFMSIMDAFETLFIVKKKKFNCRNVFCNEKFDEELQ
jgi:hypothetical protein